MQIHTAQPTKICQSTIQTWATNCLPAIHKKVMHQLVVLCDSGVKVEGEILDWTQLFCCVTIFKFTFNILNGLARKNRIKMK